MSSEFDIREDTDFSNEKEFEQQLRPLTFSDFSGQRKIVENLQNIII